MLAESNLQLSRTQSQISLCVFHEILYFCLLPVEKLLNNTCNVFTLMS